MHIAQFEHHRKKILYVDDDPSVLKVTRDLLEHKGYQVETAGTGQRAVEQICKQFDLIIVDYNLPDFNGDVVAERFKLQQPSVPILMVTGDGGLPDHALDNVNGFLMKGSGFALLFGAISELTETVQ